MQRIIWVLLVAILVPVVALSQEKQKKLDPCAVLTATDAANMMGAPMKIVDLSKNHCSYGEYRGRGSFVTGGVLDRMLTFGFKKYKDRQAEDKEWGKTKVSALGPDHKDQTQVLTGIGDEAYLVGRTNDGKLTDYPKVYVRKDTVTFSIEVLLAPGHQPVTLSADALIAAAKKIADQL